MVYLPTRGLCQYERPAQHGAASERCAGSCAETTKPRLERQHCPRRTDPRDSASCARHGDRQEAGHSPEHWSFESISTWHEGIRRRSAADYRPPLGFGRRSAREASTWRRARHSFASSDPVLGVDDPVVVTPELTACVRRAMFEQVGALCARYIAATGTPATSPALSSAPCGRR